MSCVCAGFPGTVKPVGCLGACDQAPAALVLKAGRERICTRIKSVAWFALIDLNWFYLLHPFTEPPSRESEEKKPCFSRFLKQIKVEKSAEVVQHATGRTLDLRDPDMLQRFTSVRRVRIRQQACQESKWNAALAGISEEIAQSSGMRRWQLRIEYGQLLRRAGLFEEAMTEVSEVHKAFPTSIEVLMEFAQILSKLGRVEHITDLEAHVRSICCDPEDVRLEMELILRLGRLKAEAVEVTETPIDVREPRIEGYAIWSLRDVTLVSKHSAIYHFVSKDRQRGTPNPRGRGRTVWPKTWHVTLLARLGANSEGPLPWIERDYTPISTAKEWEQGQCDILIKIYNDGQATSWLQQQPLGIRIWFSQPVKTLSVPSLLPDLDQAPFRPASYLLLLAGTGIVAAAQVLHHAERGKCFGSSPTINSPIRLVHSCRSDDVLMSFELLDWCTKGLLKSWTLLLTEAEAGMTPFPDVQDADLTNCASTPNVAILRSRVSCELIRKELNFCPRPCRVLVSGPAGFNAACQSMLREVGFESDAVTILSA